MRLMLADQKAPNARKKPSPFKLAASGRNAWRARFQRTFCPRNLQKSPRRTRFEQETLFLTVS
jgi:hypothetical protein